MNHGNNVTQTLFRMGIMLTMVVNMVCPEKKQHIKQFFKFHMNGEEEGSLYNNLSS